MVAFVYTHCRDASECPLVTAKLARVQSGLGSAPIHIVTMTVDPAHDDPAALESYGRTFGANPARWSFVTGKPAAVILLEQRLGVDVAIGPGDEIAHTEEIVIVGPDGRVADRIGGSAWTSDQVLARARSVASLPSDVLANLRLSLSRGIAAICGGGVSGISLAAALAIFAGALAAFGIVASRALLSNLR